MNDVDAVLSPYTLNGSEMAEVRAWLDDERTAWVEHMTKLLGGAA